jgi:hypothetical protein
MELDIWRCKIAERAISLIGWWSNSPKPIALASVFMVGGLALPQDL